MSTDRHTSVPLAVRPPRAVRPSTRPGRRAQPAPAADAPLRDLWAVVLTGGETARLRPLVAELCGDQRPKQYAALLDSRALLRQTLDRVGRRVPTERTVVVAVESQAADLTEHCRGPRGPHVLLQPHDRGTAAGVLLPAHWIGARDPEATMAVFPSDHFVLEEERFVEVVDAVSGFVARHPSWIVVLGV
ncbi:MAG TPA: sugar phosphate nucleotidyltransferase, partial [Acidimicrobiales bacterium]|nr:sugar phosphate nucleotidyltransferase [Acidimicrobiales bacterium]